MGLKIPLVNYLMGAVLEGSPRLVHFNSLVVKIFEEMFISKLTKHEGNRTLRGDKYLADSAASVLQWLVVFIAVPMPLWGSSSHWICIGERGAKGQWHGVSWEGNKQAACFSQGDRDLLARREE